MKRIVLIIVTLALVSASLVGCANNNTEPSAGVSQTGAPQTGGEQIVAPQSTPTAQATTSQLPPYSFSFEDVDGNVHNLSDYSGKPVYLEVWGTWCSVCMSSLPDLDKFAGEQHDFTVLSVVAPGASGEKNKDDFIKWYKEQGYKNLTVLLDDKWQVLNDFGINAYPTSIIFDGSGVPITGFAGLMPKDTILQTMQEVADGTYKG